MIKIDGKEYRNLEEQVDYLTEHSDDYDQKITDLTNAVALKVDKTYVDKKVPNEDTAGKVLTSSGDNANTWETPLKVVANNGEATTAKLSELKVNDVNYKVDTADHSFTIADELPTGVESVDAKYLGIDDTKWYKFAGGGSGGHDYILKENMITPTQINITLEEV